MLISTGVERNPGVNWIENNGLPKAIIRAASRQPINHIGMLSEEREPDLICKDTMRCRFDHNAEPSLGFLKVTCGLGPSPMIRL